MTTAHQVYDEAVRHLPRSERLRLAALILDELARMEEATGEVGISELGPAPIEASPPAVESEEDDAAAAKRAERMTPRLEELEQIIAAGVKPQTWYDGDQALV
jgi:hypothetical protein